ncbi:CoA transferase [Haloferax marisrubri]|uniref:CoA transferase n=2 Tax=Haloferax marisrubri TaxID=1544719 RepID=A0A2P4NM11_9EURY|nr:CoA transferase [Haloferax marisrubri]
MGYTVKQTKTEFERGVLTVTLIFYIFEHGNRNEMKSALEDVKIADFTQMMQGPWATQKLAEMGADVIKIERIGGEWERTLEAGGELYEGTSPFFLAMNRNKRSITLDLKSEEGQEVALDIIRESDVLVENFRPGVMEKFGLGYDDVCEANPEIIYVSGSGFGSSGPYVDRPGQDLLLQAMTGLANQTGRRDDPPTPAGSAVVDEHSAMLIAFSILVALYHKQRTGEGQRAEVNLMNSAIDFQCQEITAALSTDMEVNRSEAGISSPFNSGPYGIYETADGHVAIAMAPVDVLADTLGLEELQQYDGTEFEDRDEIKRVLEAYTRECETESLLTRLLDADVWASKVNDFHEMAEDPQVQHNDMVRTFEHPEVGEYTTTGIPVTLSETPGEITSQPPMPGEHTDEVLGELDYSDEQIRKLHENDVVSRTD